MTARYILLSGTICTLFACGEAPYTIKPTEITVSPKTPNTPDTTNQYIYDFMKMVIADKQLGLTSGLQIEPEHACDPSVDDQKFLETLLIKKAKPKADTYMARLPECLTKADIDAMFLQKEKLKDFKWDNTRLGFDLSNRKDWYCFSVPLFSKDRKKAVMMIRDLCPGLCGSGQTVLFTKENNNWS